MEKCGGANAAKHGRLSHDPSVKLSFWGRSAPGAGAGAASAAAAVAASCRVLKPLRVVTMSGILVWFELWEGKKAMETKEKCAEMKRKVGAKGLWKSVALTLRMVDRFKNNGRVLISDSWFGSVPCAVALFEIAVYWG